MLRPSIVRIVIVIIIVIIGEAINSFHDVGIIAQSHLSRALSCFGESGKIPQGSEMIGNGLKIRLGIEADLS